jgi:hypothetical protein
MIKKLIREPLLHFLLIGAALFVLYDLQNEDTVDDSRQIVISQAEIDRMITLWEKKWQRLPTRQELDGLIEAQIKEEVLYREALAMGLDQDDTIVRRRLAQKVEFISSDIASQADPTEEDLQAYLDANPDKFARPGLVSFEQVFLNADRRGEQVERDAELLLAELKGDDGTLDLMEAGDSFMFGVQHETLTRHGISRLFGNQFAEAVFDLPVGEWQGPVRSGYGLHLVRINSRSESQPRTLDEVRDKVRDEWLAQQQRQHNEAFYEALRARYDIVVEPFVATKDQLAGAGQ